MICAIHDLNLAVRYCDYLILLNQGKIESMGLPENVLTPETIKQVYGVEVLVRRHPITNSPYLMPLPHQLKFKEREKAFMVHLICGAGSGAPLMYELSNRGYHVTAGVLNALDTDHEVANHLKIPVVDELPFSPASNEAHETNSKFACQADIVVLTDIPIGWGNLKNLEAAEKALEIGVPVIIVEATPLAERDFTGGEATKRLSDLKLRGAGHVRDPKEIFSTIDAIFYKTRLKTTNK